MAKCSECGYLASRNLRSRQLEETEQEIRAEGRLVTIWNSGKPISIFEPPVCFMRVADYKPAQYHWNPDTYKDAVKAEIQKERICNEFTSWQQGFTPKEHREVEDRKFLHVLEEKRRQNDRKWHWIELLVLVVGAGLFTLLGAWVSKGIP